MDMILNLSYLLSALGVVLCVVAYFVLPKILRSALSEDSDSETENEEP
jgi:hypothetical protein